MNILENFAAKTFEILTGLPEIIKSTFGSLGPIPSSFIAVVLLFFAFFSYKIFKVCLCLLGVGLGLIAGEAVLAPILSQFISFEYLSLVCGIVLAIPFAIIAVRLCRTFIYFCTASAVYSVSFPMLWYALLPYEGTIGYAIDIIINIIALVLAILAGMLVLKIFKPVFIISSALGCSVMAALAVAIGFTAADSLTLGLASAAGVAVAVIAIIVQFKNSQYD